MTDDKGAGEGPYKFGDSIKVDGKKSEWYLGGYSEVKIANAAHAAGRKAERERCARIADDEAIEHTDGDESYMCGAVEEIAKRIRGGQDGE